MAIDRETGDTGTRAARGRWAESAAERYLCRRGLRVLARNYRSRFGEIDLIMRDGDVVVFVEVRFRDGSDFAAPEETVTQAKRQRLMLTARRFLQQHATAAQRPCRFDVVAITRGEGKARLKWLREAFGA